MSYTCLHVIDFDIYSGAWKQYPADIGQLYILLL